MGKKTPCGGKLAQLITLDTSQQWNMVVAALYCGDAFLQQGKENKSELNVCWVAQSKSISKCNWESVATFENCSSDVYTLHSAWMNKVSVTQWAKLAEVKHHQTCSLQQQVVLQNSFYLKSCTIFLPLHYFVLACHIKYEQNTWRFVVEMRPNVKTSTVFCKVLWLAVLCPTSRLQKPFFLTLSNHVLCGWSVEGILASWQSASSVTRASHFCQQQQMEKMRETLLKKNTLQHMFW